MLNDYRRERLHLEKAAGFILETRACSLWQGLNTRGPCSGGGASDLVETPRDFKLVSRSQLPMGIIISVLLTLHNMEERIRCKGKL